MRNIDDHFDGFGLNDSITLQADDAGTGGASHHYTATVGGVKVLDVQFQHGARDEAGSTPGVTDRVLLAVLLDRMRSFQSGPFGSRLNSLALTAIEQAMLWLHQRTMERDRRGVLGKEKA